MSIGDRVFAMKDNYTYRPATILGYINGIKFQIHFDDTPMDEVHWRYEDEMKLANDGNDILRGMLWQ